MRAGGYRDPARAGGVSRAPRASVSPPPPARVAAGGGRSALAPGVGGWRGWRGAGGSRRVSVVRDRRGARRAPALGGEGSARAGCARSDRADQAETGRRRRPRAGRRPSEAQPEPKLPRGHLKLAHLGGWGHPSGWFALCPLCQAAQRRE